MHSGSTRERESLNPHACPTRLKAAIYDMQIHVIDLGFQNVAGAIAVFLVESTKGLALVETGPTSTHEAVVAGILRAGRDPREVTDVLVTHIHLDHAGGAGWWAAQGAKVWVHERGAQHLVDPSKLLASAGRIYGDRMDSLWGTMIPAPAAQVEAIGDGAVIEVGDLRFKALDTPGHARHHLAFALGDTVFAGDAAGIRIGANRLILPASAPPQFELEAFSESFDKILGSQPTSLHLTHFGRFENPKEHLGRYAQVLEEAVQFGRDLGPVALGSEDAASSYREFLQRKAVDAGVTEADFERYERANPTGMSLDGILLYLQKTAARNEKGGS